MTSPDTPATTDEENRTAGAPGVRGALVRFSVMAYIVGVGLLALCFSMIMEYGFDDDRFTAIVGPVHGFLYIVYLVVAVDLAIKARWSMKGTILVMLAGVVPFFSFVAERRVTRKVRDGVAL